MPTVETVRGPIDTSDLGRVLMHEHVFVLSTEIMQNHPTGWDEERRVADAVARLRELKAAGIGTIVDLTVVGLGRYVPRIERVNAEVDINIIVATGLYTFDHLPHYFFHRPPRDASTDVMTEVFVHDVVHGIPGTGVKAGIFKCATDEPGVTKGVERVLRAVAQAHRATGVPISTHTHVLTRRGLQQQDVFEQEGVDLSRVVIGHSGDSTDLVYLAELMTRGSYIGMDRFGLDMMLPFEQRVDTVARLCAQGFAGQMVLSHDAACFNDWLPGETLPGAPNWHFLHITNDVVPALKARGVTDDQLQQMLVDNPRAIFERERKPY